MPQVAHLPHKTSARPVKGSRATSLCSPATIDASRLIRHHFCAAPYVAAAKRVAHAHESRRGSQ
eukprot:scaffold40197_cov33-Tisochrysis_lutea.AAC.4